MELFTKDRDMYVGCQPRACDRTETQLFHAFHNAAHGTVSLHEVDNGGAECFARGLFPEGWEAHRLLHIGCPKNEFELQKTGDFASLPRDGVALVSRFTHTIYFNAICRAHQTWS
jgi:hypothetical protein